MQKERFNPSSFRSLSVNPNFVLLRTLISRYLIPPFALLLFTIWTTNENKKFILALPCLLAWFKFNLIQTKIKIFNIRHEWFHAVSCHSPGKFKRIEITIFEIYQNMISRRSECFARVKCEFQTVLNILSRACFSKFPKIVRSPGY